MSPNLSLKQNGVPGELWVWVVPEDLSPSLGFSIEMAGDPVYLDAAEVRELHDYLSQWLNGEKVEDAQG